MEIRRGVVIGAGAVACLALLATRATVAAPALSTAEPFPPEVPRMVVFELFAPAAAAG